MWHCSTTVIYEICKLYNNILIDKNAHLIHYVVKIGGIWYATINPKKENQCHAQVYLSSQTISTLCIIHHQ